MWSPTILHFSHHDHHLCLQISKNTTCLEKLCFPSGHLDKLDAPILGIPMDSLTNFTTQNGGCGPRIFTPIRSHHPSKNTELHGGSCLDGNFCWKGSWESFCLTTNFVPGKKKSQVLFGGNKNYGFTTPFGCVLSFGRFYKFLTHHKCFVSMHFFQPLAKLKLVVVSVVTKEWHRLESGHSADWYPNITHTIHVWYIHLHLVNIYGFHVGKYTIHGSYGLQRHEHVVHESCHNDTFQHPEGTLNTWVSDWLPRRPHPAALQSWFKAICRNKADLKHNYISTNS